MGRAHLENKSIALRANSQALPMIPPKTASHMPPMNALFVSNSKNDDHIFATMAVNSAMLKLGVGWMERGYLCYYGNEGC